MPSLGYRLSDSQVAAVVTYVRNSWGNAAAPVTEETVKALRAQVTGPAAQRGDEQHRRVPAAALARRERGDGGDGDESTSHGRPLAVLWRRWWNTGLRE